MAARDRTTPVKGGQFFPEQDRRTENRQAHNGDVVDAKYHRTVENMTVQGIDQKKHGPEITDAQENSGDQNFCFKKLANGYLPGQANRNA